MQTVLKDPQGHNHVMYLGTADIQKMLKVNQNAKRKNSKKRCMDSEMKSKPLLFHKQKAHHRTGPTILSPMIQSISELVDPRTGVVVVLAICIYHPLISNEFKELHEFNEYINTGM